MTQFVMLTCPSCGSRLQVTNDLETFACGHCSNELIVRRGGGIIALLPVVEGLDRFAAGVARVNQGVDRTASELALVRLKHEIEEIQRRGRQAEADLRARPYSADWGGLLPNLVLFGVLFLLIGSLTRGIASAILWIGVILLISAILGHVLLPKPGRDSPKSGGFMP